MSTSPSWFDQEKFSRLVKKVGTATRSGGAQSTPPLPVSRPSATGTTGFVRLSPAPTPAAEVSAPTSSAAETPALPTAAAIPKPAAALPLFTYKEAAPAAAEAETTPLPAAKASGSAPEEKIPEPPPAASATVAHGFPPPPSAEVSASEPEPKTEEEGKPKVTFETARTEPEVREEKKPEFSPDIPPSELPARDIPPESPTEKIESTVDFHVAEPPHVSPKPEPIDASTFQSFPRIMSGGSSPSAPSTPVSTLLRRTASLPGVKPLAVPLQPIERTEAPIRAADAPALSVPSEETLKTWESPVVLPDEIASWKEQIAYLNKERDNLAAKVEELSRAALQSDEVTRVTGERDAARRDYAELRQQFEKIKQEQLRLKNEHAASLADLQKQMIEAARLQGDSHEREQLRLKNEHAVALADLQKQIEAARLQGGSRERESATAKDDVIETLKQELKSLHEQVARAKDETSLAQRGLALSQKALQETRDALREAADAKGALDDLRKERSTLVQQSMLLQAQNDQIARELSALKARISK